MNLYIDPSIKVAELKHAADLLGCKLVNDRLGSLALVPVDHPEPVETDQSRINAPISRVCLRGECYD